MPNPANPDRVEKTAQKLTQALRDHVEAIVDARSSTGKGPSDGPEPIMATASMPTVEVRTNPPSTEPDSAEVVEVVGVEEPSPQRSNRTESSNRSAAIVHATETGGGRGLAHFSADATSINELLNHPDSGPAIIMGLLGDREFVDLFVGTGCFGVGDRLASVGKLHESLLGVIQGKEDAIGTVANAVRFAQISSNPNMDTWALTLIHMIYEAGYKSPQSDLANSKIFFTADDLLGSAVRAPEQSRGLKKLRLGEGVEAETAFEHQLKFLITLVEPGLAQAGGAQPSASGDGRTRLLSRIIFEQMMHAIERSSSAQFKNKAYLQIGTRLRREIAPADDAEKCPPALCYVMGYSPSNSRAFLLDVAADLSSIAPTQLLTAESSTERDALSEVLSPRFNILAAGCYLFRDRPSQGERTIFEELRVRMPEPDGSFQKQVVRAQWLRALRFGFDPESQREVASWFVQSATTLIGSPHKTVRQQGEALIDSKIAPICLGHFAEGGMQEWKALSPQQVSGILGRASQLLALETESERAKNQAIRSECQLRGFRLLTEALSSKRFEFGNDPGQANIVSQFITPETVSSNPDLIPTVSGGIIKRFPIGMPEENWKEFAPKALGACGFAGVRLAYNTGKTVRGSGQKSQADTLLTLAGNAFKAVSNGSPEDTAVVVGWITKDLAPLCGGSGATSSADTQLIRVRNTINQFRGRADNELLEAQLKQTALRKAIVTAEGALAAVQSKAEQLLLIEAFTDQFEQFERKRATVRDLTAKLSATAFEGRARINAEIQRQTEAIEGAKKRPCADFFGGKEKKPFGTFVEIVDKFNAGRIALAKLQSEAAQVDREVAEKKELLADIDSGRGIPFGPKGQVRLDFGSQSHLSALHAEAQKVAAASGAVFEAIDCFSSAQNMTADQATEISKSIESALHWRAALISFKLALRFDLSTEHAEHQLVEACKRFESEIDRAEDLAYIVGELTDLGRNDSTENPHTRLWNGSVVRYLYDKVCADSKRGYVSERLPGAQIEVWGNYQNAAVVKMYTDALGRFGDETHRTFEHFLADSVLGPWCESFKAGATNLLNPEDAFYVARKLFETPYQEPDAIENQTNLNLRPGLASDLLDAISAASSEGTSSRLNTGKRRLNGELLSLLTAIETQFTDSIRDRATFLRERFEPPVRSSGGNSNRVREMKLDHAVAPALDRNLLPPPVSASDAQHLLGAGNG